MSKDYFVIRGGKVVYAPGHYDLEGATATAKAVSRAHPKAVVRIVKLVESYQSVPSDPAGVTLGSQGEKPVS